MELEDVKNRKLERINFTIEKELYDKLQKFVEDNDLNRSRLISKLIDEFLKDKD